MRAWLGGRRRAAAPMIDEAAVQQKEPDSELGARGRLLAASASEPGARCRLLAASASAVALLF